MGTQPRQRIQDLILGPLPVSMVNRLFGLELLPGKVFLSRAAQIHASRRHPHDYESCLPHISRIIAEPLYIGDDFKNKGKIELIGRAITDRFTILIAVKIEPETNGHYHVVSFYPIAERKVENRRAKGYLKVAL